MRNILKEGSAELGVSLSERQLDQLEQYASVLVEWNEKMNLTAITEPGEIAVKHFLDCLTPIPTGLIRGNVIDVGTGAGFPGLVLKIACPDISLTLLDSLNKRIRFLQTAAEELDIRENIRFVHARAEDAARQERAAYDTAVSRAVANLAALSEFCLPFLKTGGYFIALKGPTAEEEVESAKRAIYILGGEVQEVITCRIPFSELSHKLVVIKKVRQTPSQYPRKAGIPTKTPIDTCYNLKKGAGK